MKNNLKNAMTAIVILTVVVLLSIVGSSIVYGAEDNLSVASVNITEKSDTATVEKLSFEGTAIDCNVTFHKLNDYAKFRIEIKNNGNQDYKVKSITSNNENEYITYDGSESIGTKVEADSSAVIYIVAKYSKAVDDIANRNQDMNVDFEIILEDDLGNTQSIGVNPKTGDSIIIYMTMFGASALALIVFIILSKNSKKSMKIFGLILVLVLVAPIIVYAEGNLIALTINSKFALKDKLVLTYTDADNEEKTKNVNYGESINVLDPIEAEGEYVFDGWVDSNGKKVEKTLDDVTVTPNMVPKEYTITYNLDGGKIEGVSSYTIESETFTLPIPKREGYVFTGWTGDNGETPEREVTIEKGTTGNKTYTANWEEYEAPVAVGLYQPPTEVRYMYFKNSWKSTSETREPFDWSQPLPSFSFNGEISRARLSFSKTGYNYDYPSQSYANGFVSIDKKTMWFDDDSGHPTEGYYVVGYTEDGVDHEMKFRIVSGAITDYEMIY